MRQFMKWFYVFVHFIKKMTGKESAADLNEVYRNQPKLQHFLSAAKKRKIVARVSIYLALVVAFTTTFSLILPAITVTKDTVGAGVELAIADESNGIGADDDAVSEVEYMVHDQADGQGAETGSSVSDAADGHGEEEADASAETTDRAENAASGTAIAGQQIADEAEHEELMTSGDGERIRDFSVDGADYTLHVQYGADAGIPENAEFVVTPLTEGTDFDTYQEKALKTIADTDEDLADAWNLLGMFDLTIYDADGNSIQPTAPVKVSVDFGENLKAGTQVYAVHFPGSSIENTQDVPLVAKTAKKALAKKQAAHEVTAEEVAPEIIGAENDGEGTVRFDAEGFSVYAIVGTVIEKNVLASDGRNYKISVTCGDDAGIPDGADLKVAEITEGFSAYGKSYEEYVAYTEHALGMEEGSAEYIRLFDIKLVDENGAKVQPAEGTSVDVRIELADADAGYDLSVVHFADGSDEGYIVDNSTENGIDGSVVEFAAEGFSVYAVTDDTYFCTYRFYSLNEYGDYTEYALNTDQGSVTFTQKVKNGESILAPQNPDNLSEPETTFTGWYAGNMVEEDGTSVLQLEDEPFDFNHLPPVTEHSAINLYAVFTSFAYVNFHGQYDSETGTWPVISTRRGELTGAGTGSTVIKISDVNANYNDGTGEPLQSMVFYGWSYAPVRTPGEGLSDVIDEDSVTITADADLYPVYRAVRWLSFSSGSHATYYGPEYHYIGTGRTSLPTPERQGYVFDGWYVGAVVDGADHILNLNGSYTDPDSGMTYPQATKISTADGALISGAADNEAGVSVQSGSLLLSKNATLYANWIADDVDYTIIIWTEQTYQSDIYDFREQFALRGATGTSVSVPEQYTQLTTDTIYNSLHDNESVSGETNPYYGFVYNSEKSDTASKVIARDGTTVLNVYYKLTAEKTPAAGTFDLTFKDSETTDFSSDLNTDGSNGIVKSGIAPETVISSYVSDDPESGREGYTFNGWYADPSCTVRVFFENDAAYSSYEKNKLLYATMPGADLTVYAGWIKTRYLVQIDPNYGALYWDNGSSGTGATWFMTDYGELISEYLHVTREYEESPSGTFYFINHDYDYYQAKGGDRKTYYTEDIGSATDYTTYKYAPNTYQYDGWYEVDLTTGQETPYDFSTPINHDTYLRLHWKKAGLFYVEYNPEVTLDGVTLKGTLTGGDEGTADALQYEDQANVIVNRSSIAPEGYEFIGWKIRGDKSDSILRPSDSFQLPGDDAVTVNGKETIVLDAVYTRVSTASILYDANGGTISDPDYGASASGEGLPDPVTWCEDDIATIANLVNNSGIVLSNGTGFTRSGAVLAGWNTEPDGSGAHFDLGGTYAVDTSGSPVLYAEWKVRVYFDKGDDQAVWDAGWDSSYTKESEKYYTEVFVNAHLAEPADTLTNTNLNFEHWSTVKNGEAYRFQTETITEETTLYACWTDDLLVPYYAVEVNGEEKADRSGWKKQSFFKLGENDCIDLNNLNSYVEVPAGYTVYACVSDSSEVVSDADTRQITTLTRDADKAKVTCKNGTQAELLNGQYIYLVLTPVDPQPVKVRVRYVKEGANGELTAIQGSVDGSEVSDIITYGYASLTLNDASVAQDQEITIGTEDFRFGQGNTAYFNIPPTLDDGTRKLELIYNKIGLGSSDDTYLSALAGKSNAQTLHLQMRGAKLKWSFDGETWTDFDDEQPTVFAIYRERGYDLEITKTIPVTTWTSAKQDFTLTLTSMAITGESYDVKGTGYESISARPGSGTEPGSIVLHVRDGSDIKILGLPRGDYAITESGNENYTLTARTGAAGSSLSDASVSDNSISLSLAEDTRIDLTNTPDVICRIGDVLFYTLNEALAYAGENLAGTATIRMLVDYTMPASDALEIPAGYNITLATSNTSYTGSGTSASITRAADFTDASMFTNYGTLTFDTILLDGNSVVADNAMVRNAGTLNVNAAATLQNANSTGNGGAILSTAGAVNLEGSVSKNRADTGGAVYASGGEINVTGANLTNNNANNGGAIYYSGNGVLNISEGRIEDNTASDGDGGAIYVAGGTVNITGGAIDKNTAENGKGGAIYATSALITIADEASLSHNTAQSGGAIYADNGTIRVSGGTVADNAAVSVDGGAVSIGTGSITITGGNMTGNAASSGNGGAVYTDSATVTMSGGALTGNRAVNGSAVFTDAGTANFSGGKITENSAASGGAVGIGSGNVKLNFTGAPVISGNTMDGEASNVYLNVDADTVINTTGLASGANIGIYVPGEFTGDLFIHRGEAAASFASYPTSTVTNMTCFHNDRLPELTVVAETDSRKLLWGKALSFEVRCLESWQKGLPPAQTGQSKYTNNAYYPAASANVVSELAGDMYSLFASKLTATAAFGGAFVEGDTSYENFITDVNWNNETQKWEFVRRTGEIVTDKKLILYYAEPAYITIENNTGHALDISNLTVLGRSAANSSENAGYGYVVARDGATADKLLPIDQSDLKLGAGHSIKLMFPGAVNQAYSLSGTFTGVVGEIAYTRTGTAEGTITEEAANDGFTLSGKTLNVKGGVLEIKFGGEKPICKIVTDAIASVSDSEIAGKTGAPDGKVEYTFSTLKQAIAFIQTHDLKNAAVEMLIDYLIPASDVVTLPQGYDITFTTAISGIYQYEGTDPDRRATISRDSGNLQSIISSNVAADSGTKLTVENLNFDGKSLVGNINGGVIKTLNCDVTLKNADFVNCIANNGGGVYIEFSGAAGNNKGSLNAENVVFRNCRAKSTTKRQGGGAIWTDAATLELTGCSFTNCTAYDQGGAVFHRVDGNYETHTTMSGCSFENCEAQAAGAFESDAKYVKVKDSSFKNCIATQRNGGGINVYSVNSAAPAASVGSVVEVTRCTFDNCHAYNTSSDGNGGGLRSTAVTTTVTDCTFHNTSARQGGAISASNTNATSLTVTGTDITSGSATQKGGGIYCTALTVQIGADGSSTDTTIQNCTAGQNGGGICHERSGASSSVTLQNTLIEECVSTGGAGGGLQTNARKVQMSNTSVLGCKASGNGGGVNSTDKDGGMLTVDGCAIQGNQSGGMGGGIYGASQMTLRNDSIISGNQLTTDTAGNAAGVYLANKLTVGTEGAEQPDRSSIVDNLTVSRTPSDLRMRTNGSNNHTESVSVLCDLDGEIYVVNANSRGTQFGLSSNSYPGGFTDIEHVFKADDGSLYGIIDRADANGKKIIWCTPPICKITDERGRLLFFDTEGTSPAIFDKLDVGNQNIKNRTAAFSYLRDENAKFYYKNGTEYTGDSFAVKMLVETYEQTKYITANNAARKITLTTAGVSDSDGYPYTGRAGSRATIIRSQNLGGSMINVGTKLILQSITLDGGALAETAKDGNRILYSSNNNAEITLGVNATLQNYSSTNNGAGVYLRTGAKLNIAGGTIRNCSATRGGGVYMENKADVLNFEAGTITLCSATERGGGICVQGGGTVNMNGGSITRSNANWGGGVFVSNNNTAIFNMSGGSIIGNRATEHGGGIDAEGVKTRLYFSGLVNVSDNTFADGTTCNLGLRSDSNSIINSEGLYRGSIIGVYVEDGTNLFDKHGNEGQPFGSFTGDTNYLYCFTNDRNGLKGGLINGGEKNTIYWVVIFSLEVSKNVVSDSVADTLQSFDFTVTLSGASDNNSATLGSSFNGVYSDDEEGKMNFTNGVAHFSLKNGESVTAINLPAGIIYTVEENLSDEQKNYYKVLPHQTITGKIGENLNAEDVDYKYLSKAAFTNLHAVCKITAPVNGGTLLYYKNDDDEYTPAVYSRLNTAFQTVNYDVPYYWDVYSDQWKPYTGTEQHIEMLIPDYTMTDPITLNDRKTVTLTTASQNAKDGYPYVGSGSAKVKRGFGTGSMFTVNGSLTLTDIDLDGNASTYTVSGNGGIVSVQAKGNLTVTDGAVLENANTDGNGGAVYVADGAALTLTGTPTIRSNTAANGAGIYLDGENSRLYIQDAPKFEGNYSPIASGSEYNKKENGGDSSVYADAGTRGVRQDIYLPNTSSEDARNIVVTGDLTGADGSIWVWADHENHYKKRAQFAVMDKEDAVYAVTAFRNAQADDVTGNDVPEYASPKYLTGVLKQTGRNVYWGIDGTVALKIVKVDQSGNPLEDAVFTLEGRGASADLIISKNELKSERKKTDEEGKDTNNHAVVFADSAMPVGTYTLTETTPPAGYNILEAPVIIEVQRTSKGMTVSASIDKTDLYPTYLTFDKDTDEWIIKVTNQSGYELPSTGGPGTKLIYILGIMLTGLAGVILVRRRMM